VVLALEFVECTSMFSYMTPTRGGPPWAYRDSWG